MKLQLIENIPHIIIVLLIFLFSHQASSDVEQRVEKWHGSGGNYLLSRHADKVIVPHANESTLVEITSTNNIVWIGAITKSHYLKINGQKGVEVRGAIKGSTEIEIYSEEGDVIIGEINENSYVKITAKSGNIKIMNDVNGSSTVVAVADKGNIYFRKDINGSSRVVARASNGSILVDKDINGQSILDATSDKGHVVIGKDINGSSRATIVAPNGPFSAAKIDGKSHVTWCARTIQAEVKDATVVQDKSCLKNAPQQDTPNPQSTNTAILGDIAPNPTTGASVFGRVTFIGTIQQVSNGNVFQSRFRFRVSSSTCDDGTGRKGDGTETRWFNVRSGKMTAPQVHNATNTSNAYNTVLAAFLNGNGIQVDGVADCKVTDKIELELQSSAIGILQYVPPPVL